MTQKTVILVFVDLVQTLYHTAGKLQPQGESSLLPTLINKVLLGYGHLHFLTYCPCLTFCSNIKVK